MQPQGFKYLPGWFGPDAQRDLLAHVRAGLEEAPLYRPAMPRTGKEMTLLMSNFGPLGWVTDKERGYRYQSMHPATGHPWPPIPPALLGLWKEVADYDAPPQACLINYYDARARLGLHVDADEADRTAPVVSVSLGDEAVFRIADTPGAAGPTTSMRLFSGDVVVLGGAARRCRHGVDRVLPGTSRLLPEAGFAEGGRINLTLRRVTPP
jgi:alkylated DNA repair protein (DNA oxidative demethylase)